MKTLSGKNILLGISGGIAAYKTAELIRLLRNADASVQVVMTDHAKQFVTPLTLQVLSGKQVFSDLFDSSFEHNIGHIELAKWADIILIAPASANLIARLSHGLADDLLTTLCLATNAPIAIAPAMNKLMWLNQATQDNVANLIQRNVRIIGPDEGEQACGDLGLGRLKEPMELLSWLEAFFDTGPQLRGKKILITAGPTHEAIDPIRYISNYSSGKMGYAIAQALVQFGADVFLVSGPTHLPFPNKTTCISVTSAQEMHQTVLDHLPCEIFISVAAVSDYRPESPAVNKIKRTAPNLTLKLVKSSDILQSVVNSNPAPFTVGFAAETDNYLQHAKAKLARKKVNIIVLNAVGNGKGFGVDRNKVTVLTEKGEQIDLPELEKEEVANQLVKIIAERFIAFKNPS